MSTLSRSQQHQPRHEPEPHSYNIQAKLRNGVLSIFVHDTMLDTQWRQEFTQVSFPGHRLYDVAKVLITAIQQMINNTNAANKQYNPNTPKPIAILVYNHWCYLTVYNSNLPSFALRPIHPSSTLQSQKSHSTSSSKTKSKSKKQKTKPKSSNHSQTDKQSQSKPSKLRSNNNPQPHKSHPHLHQSHPNNTTYSRPLPVPPMASNVRKVTVKRSNSIKTLTTPTNIPPPPPPPLPSMSSLPMPSLPGMRVPSKPPMMPKLPSGSPILASLMKKRSSHSSNASMALMAHVPGLSSGMELCGSSASDFEDVLAEVCTDDEDSDSYRYHPTRSASRKGSLDSTAGSIDSLFTNDGGSSLADRERYNLFDEEDYECYHEPHRRVSVVVEPLQSKKGVRREKRMFNVVEVNEDDLMTTSEEEADEAEETDEEEFESELFDCNFSKKKAGVLKRDLVICLNGEKLGNLVDHVIDQQIAEEEYFDTEEEDELPYYDPNYLGIDPYEEE